jgi:hypothetical protein
MGWWLVTEASPLSADALPVTDVAIIEADDEQEAARVGIEYLMDAEWTRARDWERATGQAFDVPEPVQDVLVQPITGSRWRGVIAAERVPDALQCCGGMPNDQPFPGTYDQHNARCPVRPMEMLRWGPCTREQHEAWEQHEQRGGGE